MTSSQCPKKSVRRCCASGRVDGATRPEAHDNYPIGRATNFVASAVFTRSSTSCFPCDLASDKALRTSLGSSTVLPPTARMTSPDWKKPCSAASPSGSTSVTTMPFPPEPEANNLRRAFCDRVNLFADRAAFAQWSFGRNDTDCVPLEEAQFLARRRNELRYPAVALAA
jgi:Alkylmercury lyase